MSPSKFVLALLLTSMLGACASAPTQEMSDARFALRAAEDAGAQSYAHKSLALAKGTIANAEQQLESGSYIRARNYAIMARSEALRARSIALAVAGARKAIEEAAQINALPPAAVAALKNAQTAATAGDGKRAESEATKAAELAQRSVNRAYLEKARQLLSACPEQRRAVHPGLLRKAREAIAANQGKAAEDYAWRACGGAVQ